MNNNKNSNNDSNSNNCNNNNVLSGNSNYQSTFSDFLSSTSHGKNKYVAMNVQRSNPSTQASRNYPFLILLLTLIRIYTGAFSSRDPTFANAEKMCCTTKNQIA